jgi:exodeoxyribonuclease VII large subunit
LNDQKQIFSPTDFVAITNQILDTAYGFAYLEGEIANFRISKNKWVYFDLKDEFSKVQCFGSVFNLPGPIEEGMKIIVGGRPSLHNQFGFSFNFQSIAPSGEGSIKKAFDLLKAKLQKEGLFDSDRKRILPYPPKKIALIASLESAAYADFIKVLSSRWPFINIEVYDCLVQGEQAPAQISQAITSSNQQSELADILVVTRGGGSADDLSAFNDERVVRAIVSSRIPTLVAIGHEIDESLSELASDLRASTPSNAAELIAPDRQSELQFIRSLEGNIINYYKQNINNAKNYLSSSKTGLLNKFQELLIAEKNNLNSSILLLNSLNPTEILKKGYAVIYSTKNNQLTARASDIKVKDNLLIKFYDGEVVAEVMEVKNDEI